MAGVKNSETTIAKLIEVALRRYDMIEEGDRILVAVSGGKDSTSLAYDLAMKQRWWPVRFELLALHIESDFSVCEHVEGLMRGWNIPYESIDVPVIGRLKPGRSMNCYWCSTQRRTELIRYAQANGFNKIALGHHLDDIVETLMMNMLYKGEISGMMPVLKYDKYPISIIRPLALCEERQIIAFAEEKGFRSVTCSCGYGNDSKRRIVREKIRELTGGSSELKHNLYNSMSKVNLGYLPIERMPRGEE
jgi:tRNA(Ile)-lysidine synthase TilS/MesJ